MYIYNQHHAYSGVELCISKATSSTLKSFMYEYNYMCICKGFKDMYVLVEICINNVF